MFELKDYTSAVMRTLTCRVEKHGDDSIPAVTMSFQITTANTILDLLDPSLRHTLYKAVEGQDTLPGVEPSTPLLRSKGVSSLDLTAAFEGWTIHIPYGVDEKAPIVCGGAKVDGFSVSPMEGGTVDLCFKVGTSDIDAHQVGYLWENQKCELQIKLLAPVKSDEVIDGTTGHPGIADAEEAEAERQGTLLGAMQDGEPVGGENEGDEP